MTVQNQNTVTILIIISGKTNTLHTLTSRQPDVNKIYLYTKDPYETSIVNQQTWQFRIKALQ